MSVLSDSIKQSIRPLLPPTLKYGPILWIYMVCEVRTALFQCMKISYALENPSTQIVHQLYAHIFRQWFYPYQSINVYPIQKT